MQARDGVESLAALIGDLLILFEFLFSDVFFIAKGGKGLDELLGKGAGFRQNILRVAVRLRACRHRENLETGEQQEKRHAAANDATAALGACEAAVLSLKRVACLIVIETLQRWNPVDELKVFSVVFGVAGSAALTVREFCMQPAMLRQFLRDLCVTLPAFEDGGPLPRFVATGALRGPI